MSGRYLEDFAVGQTFSSGRLRINREQIKAFATQFDPQRFHLNEEAARDTIFQESVASGWHTASLTMCLLVESELTPAGGLIGAGFDELHWPRAVRPGDELHVKSEELEVRPSKSRPTQGMIKVRITTLNQNDEPVQILVANIVVPLRQSGPFEERLLARRVIDGKSKFRAVMIALSSTLAKKGSKSGAGLIRTQGCSKELRFLLDSGEHLCAIAAHEPARGGNRCAGLCRDLCCPLGRESIEFGCGHNAINKPEPQRLGGIKRLTKQQELG